MTGAPEPAFQPDSRERNIGRLREGPLDVLIIGGGINGAGIARDLALRAAGTGTPLRTGLVERRHFASGTSGRNSQLIHGGLRMHDVYHATGKVIPSHQWVEGFLDYYFLTGRKEALDAANSIGENIMRILQQPQFTQAGSTSVRENGWALRAMVGMWIGTGEDRWRIEARRIVDLFLAWMDAYDGLLAPYTSHSMPRVVFMTSLTVTQSRRASGTVTTSRRLIRPRGRSSSATTKMRWPVASTC